ncbi:hypothetical protein LNTAR_20793 [Lentisphaera araneosa HTCC2155]|uniref:DUF58 domain-containing protein n=1 Tax=Lentisphaera araneosa HTCC2155 TaxID=313628 RepID=A6DL81_9BACT|nr:DUF58 domain-containing protein [Lentisphaera araneosa]EDM27683.1 hypothetical protein LNTAR_20793 [Lentisphaera araneosa HTCC2155]
MSDLSQYLNPEVVNAVERLDLQARCIAEAYLTGRHRSAQHGFSTQFSQHRPYIKGDPIKDIDWKVYARSDKYHIKKYEAETNIECTFLVDISESMNYKSHALSKLEYATCLCAALSLILTQQQDSPGLITFDDDVRHFIQPRSSQKQLMQIIHTLGTQEESQASDFSTALPNAASMLGHKGLLVCFSDLLGDTDKALETLQTLSYGKHDIMLFHLLDPEEIELKEGDLSRFQDSERPDSKVVANPDSIRQVYQKLIQDFISKIKGKCQESKITWCFINTADPFDLAIHDFMSQRRAMM